MGLQFLVEVMETVSSGIKTQMEGQSVFTNLTGCKQLETRANNTYDAMRLKQWILEVRIAMT